jgi:cell filamentation protein
MSGKYSVPENEGQILPNKLGLTSLAEIEKEEAKGFVRASLQLTNELTDETTFNVEYINNLHYLALGHLYDFAGKYRKVNMSKGGFTFPSALHLDQSMIAFQKQILNDLPMEYNSREKLIKDIATVHGELLFIHPYREGNGRTARLLANLMAFKYGYPRINFEMLKERFDQYVKAVQQVGMGKYSLMQMLISDAFPNV